MDDGADVDRESRPVDDEQTPDEAGATTQPADAELPTDLEAWEADFDRDEWITGARLVERVERDLKARVGARDVFAEVRRLTGDRLLAYSDEGYAILTPDGSVEGTGSVMDDVTSSVALCAMEGYEVPDAPADWALPDPDSVSRRGGELGNLMLQVIGGGLALSGLVMLVAAAVGVAGRSPILLVLAGIIFAIGGVFLFVVVANARLSDRFRAGEYRRRLREAGVETGRPPPFVPVDDEEILDAEAPEANRSDPAAAETERTG